jgi:hypothetical protein
LRTRTGIRIRRQERSEQSASEQSARRAQSVVEPPRADPTDTTNGSVFGDPLRVSRLQRSIGNRAVARALASHPRAIVRRAPLTPEEQAQDLTNEPYASSERLQNAYDNSPLMSIGENSPAVALLQQGLLDDGILLPVTTQNGTAPPDGDFGSETARGVRELQQRYGLGVDGIVGRETLRQLDALAEPRTGPTEEPATETPETDVPPEGTHQSFGPEAEGLVPDMPPLSTPELVIDVLERSDEWVIYSLAQDPAFLDGMQEYMTPGQFGRAAACFCLRMPEEVLNPSESKQESLRIMGTQMAGDKDATRRAIDRIRAIVIPADRLTTDYFPFIRLVGGKTIDGRPWETVRGIARREDPFAYTAFPEDNLLGIPCTATWTPPGPNTQPYVFGQDPEGYSSASHEFAHGLHYAALSEEDQSAVQTAFETTTSISNQIPLNTTVWVDGPKGCYASLSVYEFFADTSNAYLETNTGVDSATGHPVHNGKLWVLTHEPVLYDIFERIYAGGELEGTNPVSDPLVGGAAPPEIEGLA